MKLVSKEVVAFSNCRFCLALCCSRAFQLVGQKHQNKIIIYVFLKHVFHHIFLSSLQVIFLHPKNCLCS